MTVTFAPALPALWNGEPILDMQDGGNAPCVNVSNANATTLLDLLGIEHDPCDLFGDLPADGFLGRVLIAQALAGTAADDEGGVPAVRYGNTIECGRRPGYLAERLAELHEVASWAKAHGGVVAWG